MLLVWWYFDDGLVLLDCTVLHQQLSLNSQLTRQTGRTEHDFQRRSAIRPNGVQLVLSMHVFKEHFNDFHLAMFYFDLVARNAIAYASHKYIDLLEEQRNKAPPRRSA
jgi:hypothetical protein